MKRTAQELVGKIESKKATVGIVGLGYVGSAIALRSAEAGFKTTGFDIDKRKVARIEQLKISNLTATVDPYTISSFDVICICVPTPTYHNKVPDLRPLKSALTVVVKNLRAGQLIIIESTVGVGMTRGLYKEKLADSKLEVGEDYFLGFSPERIDPGNKQYNFYNIPKVVSGIEKKSLKLVTLFYEALVKKVVPVASMETAEMTKLTENIFRFVNVSLINELADYAHIRHINIEEVIKTAATKPFAYLPHYPGPGIGGHCIPVDPYYLVHDAHLRGLRMHIIEGAGIVNNRRPAQVVRRALAILKERQIRNPYKILLAGISYKANISDTRESPALVIWKKFVDMGYKVAYYDTYVKHKNGNKSIQITKKSLQGFDLIVIVTDHTDMDYKKILQSGVPILDTRGVFNHIRNSLIYSL